jgi:hypothetical protein
MSTARSAFTEAIEEHLALKKQNSTLERAMPLARYDVGDPLDRYPGGPNRTAGPDTVVVTEDVEAADEAFATASASAPDHAAHQAPAFVGPSPEQAMEAATSLEPSFADRPFEPLNGMAPMLSLVEDIEDDTPDAQPAEPSSADVLRFPGGVGPREEAPAETEPEQTSMQTHAFSVPSASAGTADATGLDAELIDEAPTGEQPVLVIDTDEPLATGDFDEPVEPSRPSRRKPRFFGLGRKKQQDASEGWFTDGPRDFNWD